MHTQSSTPTFGGVSYSIERGTLIDGNQKTIELRRQCLDVFLLLASYADTVVMKEDIVREIWGNIAVTDDSVVQCIGEIRKALGDRHKRILRTIPRRGYMLVADTAPVEEPVTGGHGISATSRSTRAHLNPRWLSLVVVCLIAVLAVWTASRGKVRDQDVSQTDSASDLTSDTPLLRLVSVGTASDSVPARALNAELRITLSRYRTVRLVDDAAVDANYTLQIDTSRMDAATPRVTFELIDSLHDTLVLARGHDSESSTQSIRNLAVRIGAAVASPGVGAISEHLLQGSRLKPIEQVTRAECYANGFGCVKCSGKEDNITRRAEACLAHLIERDPTDARAWGLQATIHAHQYLWANTLPEPLRSTPALRVHYRKLAVEAAIKAEELSDGKDSAIYWGMAEAYFASCQPDKLQMAIERGLAINPDDPNLMAAFGNWLSYSGKWEEGAELVRRALQIEPDNYQHWWWMGLAKTEYFKRNYQSAYAFFLKSFDERNWLSHLQMAYTLPFLGRMEEARTSVNKLRDLHPGITLESALEVYRTMCFPDSFLQDMKTGLIRAGLGSRGISEDFDDLVLPRPELLEVDGHVVEYLDVGQGEPVVFVHGAVSDYRTWGFYLLPISEQHRFISYSRRYYGTQPWKDDGEQYTQNGFADELIGLIESLNLGAVHVVSWSTGITPAILAMHQRPDLFKSAVHYEPVNDDLTDGDDSIAALRTAWHSKWQSFGEALSDNDVEKAGELLIENVFELAPGGYHLERKLHQEVVRQNARTLPLLGRRDDGDTLVDCNLLKDIQTPTFILHGADTHEYWQVMSHRFATCLGAASLQSIADTKHDGAIDRVDTVSELIAGFVDQNK